MAVPEMVFKKISKKSLALNTFYFRLSQKSVPVRYKKTRHQAGLLKLQLRKL